jgi:peptide chain release factor 2
LLKEYKTMDAERINLIGTTLQDLQERTQDLRRYL